MKKAYVAYIVIVLVFIFLLITYLLNEKFISQYKKENFDKASIAQVKNLRPFSYISRYNSGNYNYKMGMYDEAIKEYQKALKLFPPEKKECSIRINLALAMLKKINLDDIETEEDIDEVIAELEQAKEVLLEDGCANRYDNNGHSEEAEKLKKEIEDIIDALKSQSGSQNENEDDEEEQNSEEEEEEQETANGKERQLRQINSDSMKERRERSDMTSREYEYYGGKKW